MRQQRQQQRAAPRQQRKRWESPQRKSQRAHQQRMKDYKNNYVGDPLSVRMHVSQVESLKQELSNTLQETVAKTEYIHELEEKVKTMEIDNSQLHRLNMITEKKLESFKKNLHQTTRQYSSLNDELNMSKAEIDRLKQSVKSETHASNTIEKRLNNVTNEIEKTKTEVSKLKEANKEQESNYKKKIYEMMKEKKSMEKQNEEMNKVIRKHMQLIGNLRRQIMHIEAAAVLKISEEQFMKALEKSS